MSILQPAPQYLPTILIPTLLTNLKAEQEGSNLLIPLALHSWWH